MAKPKKTPRPKAETPNGFRDYFGAAGHAAHADAGQDRGHLSPLWL